MEIVYRPPNSDIEQFTEILNNILSQISYLPCYIMGDYNPDLLKHECHNPNEHFCNTMYSNSLIPLIYKPTRETDSTATLIDNIFTNHYDVNDQLCQGIFLMDKNNIKTSFLRFIGNIQLLIIKWCIKTFKIKPPPCWESPKPSTIKSELLRTRTTWGKLIIKQVMNKNKNSKICDKLTSGKNTITDPKTIANTFNNYFANVEATLVSKIPDQGVDFSVHMPPANECSLFLAPASENEIKRVIANLNDGSPGTDGVTATTLKTVSDAVATPITHLANMSFIQGVFPQDRKKCSCMAHIKSKRSDGLQQLPTYFLIIHIF